MTMKKIALLIMLLLPMVASAEPVQIDGIYYNLVSKIKEAEVTNRLGGTENGSRSYSGSVDIPATVTYEGVDYSVTSIGDWAFYECSGLASVTIPNRVTSIGGGAFYGCSGLTSVTIPNSVTSIGEGAFSGCSGLTSVHISDLEAWCKIAFNNYYSNPLNFAHHLFLNGEEIKELVIPDGVTSIRNHAFYGCSGLTSVTIPNSVTSIGYEAFYRCRGLTSVTIPNSVINIGEQAFSYCSGLTSVTIPNSVTSIGKEAFSYCSGLTSVTIGNGVTSIGEGAFDNCSGLASVTIGSGVTSIGDGAFSDCSSLTSITIPNRVTSIGYYAFSCCGLTSVTIGNSVTSIRDNAFIACYGLTSVHISDLVAWCKITFNDEDSNPLYYAHHLFLNGEEIKDLVIPGSVTSIRQYAFSYCSGLTSITIPNSVTSIGWSVFSGCSGLTSVTIPNSVTSIGKEAFSYCSGLTSVTISNSVTDIGESAFAGCSSLANLTLPEDIKIIKRGTFNGCRIKSVVIPAKVEFIYADAFRCSATKEVKVLATTPPWAHDNAFSNYNIPLYVPEESVNSYQATNPWSKFSSLKTLSGEDADLKCATPTISYSNGKLTFGCETDGVEYNSSITDTDIRDYTTSSIQLSVTYTVKVYAVKSGYQNSDVATATLCWIDVEPRTDGIETGVAQVPAKAVLVQSREGVLTVQGADNGTQVSVYDINGTLAGNGVCYNGQATVSTSLQPGSIAIVKLGQKTVKVVMR